MSLATITPLSRPSKVLWTFPSIKNSEWIQSIPSTSLQKIARNKEKILKENNLELSLKELSQKDYHLWHTFYSETMIEQEHEVIASLDWFDQKKEELKKIYFLDLNLGHERVGGAIISCNKNDVFTEHFKATKRLDIGGNKNLSLGTVFEFFYLDFAFKNSPSKVTSGLSRNGFGFFNTIGYLISKLRMGYFPEASSVHQFDDIFEKKDANKQTAWVVIDNLKKEYLLVYPNKQDFNQEVITYAQRVDLPIISWTEIK